MNDPEPTPVARVLAVTATACPRCGRELLWLRGQLEHRCGWCQTAVTRTREEARQ